MEKCDYLIIGAGIIGLSMARRLRQVYPEARITVIDKEDSIAAHASSRNSGVLHGGFYYTADSLKAQLTVLGNRAMKDFCREHRLKLNECGKLVVAQNEQELFMLEELQRRGERNSSNVHLIDEKRALELEPNVRTFKKALYSPDTATIDPKEVCQALYEHLSEQGIAFRLKAAFLEQFENCVQTNNGDFDAGYVINCAGLYADKIARAFGFSKHYTILPFKGLYLKYTKNKTDVGMHIYPVPNLKNPFLGVHFTKMVDDTIKIGPTAIPVFWRENYEGLDGFKIDEFLAITTLEARLYLTNKFGFKDLAKEEMKKYNQTYFTSLASKLVKNVDPEGFTESTEPGIRAQLLDRRTHNLLQDFVIEGDEKSLHVLNAVSPGFTCAFSFAHFIVQQYLSKAPDTA